MIKTIREKLYQSKKLGYLERQLELACKIYNHILRLQRRYYKIYGKYISVQRVQKHLTKLKKRKPTWRKLNSQVIQQIAERIDFGYQKFFAKENKRPPQFKPVKRYRSLTYKQTGYKVHDNRIEIQGKRFAFVKSRDFNIKMVKQVIIKRDALNDYHVNFVLDDGRKNEPAKPGTLSQVTAFDYGFAEFLIPSNDQDISSPLFYKAYAKSIAKAVQRLHRKVTGSGNRERARQVLARLHRKLANKRLSHHWHLARQLVLANDAVIFEQLDLSAMKKRYGKQVDGLGFAKFLKIVAWLCKKFGKVFHQVDRWFPSSKRCHCCHFVNKDLTLKEREWKCLDCGTKHERNKNAAFNLLEQGIEELSELGHQLLFHAPIIPVSTGWC